MPGTNHLGRFIKECRVSLHFTSRKVEEITRSRSGLTAISHSNLLAIEKGSHVPSFDKILTLAQVFNIPARHFEEHLNRDMVGPASLDPSADPEALLSSGRTALAEGEHQRALELFLQVLAQGELTAPGGAVPSATQMGWARLEAATCRKRIGQLRLARDDFDLLLADERIDNAMVIRVSFLLAEVYRELQNYRLALLHARHALDLSGPDADPTLRAKLLTTVANVLDDRGDSAGAIATYREALNLLKHAGNRRGAALILRNLGTAYARAGDQEGALKSLEGGVAAARELHDRRGLAYGLVNLARLHHLRNDASSAKLVAAEAKEIAQAESYIEVLFMALFILWKIAQAEGQSSLTRAYSERLDTLYRKLETRSAEAEEWYHLRSQAKGVRA